MALNIAKESRLSNQSAVVCKFQQCQHPKKIHKIQHTYKKMKGMLATVQLLLNFLATVLLLLNFESTAAKLFDKHSPFYLQLLLVNYSPNNPFYFTLIVDQNSQQLNVKNNQNQHNSKTNSEKKNPNFVTKLVKYKIECHLR